MHSEGESSDTNDDGAEGGHEVVGLISVTNDDGVEGVGLINSIFNSDDHGDFGLVH